MKSKDKGSQATVTNFGKHRILSELYGLPLSEVQRMFLVFPGSVTDRHYISTVLNRIKYYGLPKAIRQYVFIRDKYTCHYCRKKCLSGIRGKDNLVIDHKTPKSVEEDNHNVNNLVAACGSCNSKKCSKSYKEFKKMSVSQFKQNKIVEEKEKAWNLYKEGLSTRVVGKLLNKSHNWVAKAVRERLSTEG